MQIHHDLLTHDGVAPSGATTELFGKTLDLGFNGDFDVKNRSWNTVFVQFPAYASADANILLKVYTLGGTKYAPGATYAQNAVIEHDGKLYNVDTAISTAASNTGWDASYVQGKISELKLGSSVLDTRIRATSAIATLTVPTAYVKKGGVWGMPMPRGLKRYFTLGVYGTTQKCSAGITDVVDTDCNPGVDWTYYKADTSGVGQDGRMETAAAKLAEGTAASIAAEAASAAVTAHAAITTGVHGLT